MPVDTTDALPARSDPPMVFAMISSKTADRHHRVTPPRPAGNAVVAVAIAAISAIGFYAGIAVISWTPAAALAAPLHRYFAGHPVAIAATVMFCAAIGILLSKYIGILGERSAESLVRDADLAPAIADDPSPADAWRTANDAGHVAAGWLDHLTSLPRATHDSRLIVRLREVLVRRSHRGAGSAAGDDLRELATRDADNAHDSLGLVRIIVWAIPMLGFLGTVIGITQTLGGLDFSDGQAAVDSLKIGLNVAFDTTALGLVLSVVAIFLQFPVERAEMELLATIDARVGRLVSQYLPSEDAADEQSTLVADLCSGIESAVAESLAEQTKLWRSTIDEAQSHWAAGHQAHSDALVRAFEVALIPSLRCHAESFENAANVIQASSMDTSAIVLEHTMTQLGTQVEQAAIAIQDQVRSADRRDHHQNESVADAVVALARAVDLLNHRLAETTPTRRAA